MKNLNIRALFLSILGTLSFYFGCVRPDPILPENYSKYPIEAKGIELADGSFRLTWNAIKSADFIEYQVIKNTGDTVPYIADSSINQLIKIAPNLELAKRIDNVDSTFFVDSFSVPASRTFLRVFAVLKNRNVSSKNIEMSIKTDAKELSINPNDVLYISEEKKIVIGDQVANKMGVYDIPTNAIVSTVPNVNFSNNLEMTYGRFNNTTELYIPSTPNTTNNFNSQISVRNLLGTQLLAFNNNSFINTDALLYDKPTNTYLSMTSLPPTIRIFNRAVNSLPATALNTVQFPTARSQTFYVFRAAPINQEAIALSITNNNSDLIWFKYDGATKSISKIGGLNTFLINITKRPFSIAPDNQGFITSGKGLIFNRSMILRDSLKLPHPEVRYPDMIYSNDGAHLYAIRIASERKEKFIDVYSYPNYIYERSIPFKSTPNRVFQDGDFLILVGRSPNTARLTMIEKVHL
jgi:hypothetical protein